VHISVLSQSYSFRGCSCFSVTLYVCVCMIQADISQRDADMSSLTQLVDSKTTDLNSLHLSVCTSLLPCRLLCVLGINILLLLYFQNCFKPIGP